MLGPGRIRAKKQASAIDWPLGFHCDQGPQDCNAARSFLNVLLREEKSLQAVRGYDLAERRRYYRLIAVEKTPA